MKTGARRIPRVVTRHGAPPAPAAPVPSLFLALSLALVASGCGPEAELEEPVPLFEEVPIEYPLALWDERVEGTTVLRVWVSESGAVDSTRVMESSGHEAFDSAAVRGGRRLRFEPATRNGEPVGIWAEVPVHFSMEGDGASRAGVAGEAAGGDAAAEGDGSDAADVPDASDGSGERP